MEPAVRLAWAATIACRLVEALGRGARPGDGTPDGALVAAAQAYLGDVGADEFDEFRDVLRRLARTDRNLAAAALDWTGLIDRRLASGGELPPPLAELVTGVEPATLDPLAQAVYAQATAREQAAPHPLFGATERRPAPPRSPHVRQAVIVAAAALIPVALMVWLAVRSLGPPESDLPSTVSELSAACEGTVFPDAPAYAGAAPHPTVVFATDYNLRLGGAWGRPPAILDEKNNALFSNAWRSNDPGEVQAVACIEVDQTQQNTIDTCNYTDPRRVGFAQPPVPLPMYRGEFTVTLYETRTGRQIHQAHISGEVTECPEKLPITASSVYTEPSAQQYVDAIGQYVDS
ncbi:hypothetical protein [Phytohabitans rumicis]|uniref:Uncharacterized protein n=1 Tax=Phytohabitans rumicis TaxID=1076125 RepID=A0A6V8KZB7_9ACTN|nr:hypothetical protein [Phytohabitans rumicis]GFJ87177.1 hypothetical protein Prum_008190 [Phytohabitans rumicis]